MKEVDKVKRSKDNMGYNKMSKDTIKKDKEINSGLFDMVQAVMLPVSIWDMWKVLGTPWWDNHGVAALNLCIPRNWWMTEMISDGQIC